MKEYKNCKYYTLDEIKDGCPTFNSNIKTENISVIIYENIPLNIGISVSELLKQEDPESFLESKSKEMIDTYLEAKQNKNKSISL